MRSTPPIASGRSRLTSVPGVRAPSAVTRSVSGDTSGQSWRYSRLVMLPDLFGYWLTGRLATEQTIASTSASRRRG